MLYRFEGDSITVLVICRYPLTEARELENIEIDMQGHRMGDNSNNLFDPISVFFTRLMEILMNIDHI